MGAECSAGRDGMNPVKPHLWCSLCLCSVWASLIPPHAKAYGTESVFFTFFGKLKNNAPVETRSISSATLKLPSAQQCHWFIPINIQVNSSWTPLPLWMSTTQAILSTTVQIIRNYKLFCGAKLYTDIEQREGFYIFPQFATMLTFGCCGCIVNRPKEW